MEYISKKDWEWISDRFLTGWDFIFSNGVISIKCDKFTKTYPRDGKYVTLDIHYLHLHDLYIDASSKENIEYICNELHKSNSKKTYLKLIKKNLVSKYSFFCLYELNQLGLLD